MLLFARSLKMLSTRFARFSTRVSSRFARSFTMLSNVVYALRALFYKAFCKAVFTHRIFYEVFFRNLSCNPKCEVSLRSGQLRSGRITKWRGPLTKWAVAKWPIYEVGGLSCEVGNCEVGELRSGKKLRSGRILRSGATPSKTLPKKKFVASIIQN